MKKKLLLCLTMLLWQNAYFATFTSHQSTPFNPQINCPSPGEYNISWSTKTPLTFLFVCSFTNSDDHFQIAWNPFNVQKDFTFNINEKLGSFLETQFINKNPKNFCYFILITTPNKSDIPTQTFDTAARLIRKYQNKKTDSFQSQLRKICKVIYDGKSTGKKSKPTLVGILHFTPDEYEVFSNNLNGTDWLAGLPVANENENAQAPDRSKQKCCPIQ